MTQIIRAIWPSYLDIPNNLPASAGITTQQMISHFIFWSVQFPILLISPHKLKWFFVAKAVVVLSAAFATVIGMTQLAGGAGDIWNQQPTVHGATKAWLIVSSMSSMGSSTVPFAARNADLLCSMFTCTKQSKPHSSGRTLLPKLRESLNTHLTSLCSIALFQAKD
jgi:nucleobase:cation symporter-1, NCS1 family